MHNSKRVGTAQTPKRPSAGDGLNELRGGARSTDGERGGEGSLRGGMEGSLMYIFKRERGRQITEKVGTFYANKKREGM